MTAGGISEIEAPYFHKHHWFPLGITTNNIKRANVSTKLPQRAEGNAICMLNPISIKQIEIHNSLGNI